MDSKAVGNFIAELRKEQGLTQKQLAEKLSVTDKAVSRWETGKGYPDIEILLSLGEVLGVSLNELLSGKRLQKEESEEQSKKHLVEAYILLKKEQNRNRKIIAAIIAAAVLISSLVVVWNRLNEPGEERQAQFYGNFDTFVLELNNMIYDINESPQELVVYEMNAEFKDSVLENMTMRMDETAKKKRYDVYAYCMDGMARACVSWNRPYSERPEYIIKQFFGQNIEEPLQLPYDSGIPYDDCMDILKKIDGLDRGLYNTNEPYKGYAVEYAGVVELPADNGKLNPEYRKFYYGRDENGHGSFGAPETDGSYHLITVTRTINGEKEEDKTIYVLSKA